MNILITLQQKDLEAVSAQQLLANYGPTSIEINSIGCFETSIKSNLTFSSTSIWRETRISGI